MAIMKNTKLTIPLELSISKDTYDKLAASSKEQGNPGVTTLRINTMCSQFLDAYASGGIVVTPDSLKQIEASLGKEIGTEGQLVIEFQKAQRRDNGEYVVDVQVPAAIWPAVEEFAITLSGEPKEMIRDICVRAIREQLSFYINAQTWEAVIYMTEAEDKELRVMFGKGRITGKEILERLKAVKEEVAA